MGKKLEELAGSLVDNELAVKVKDSANQLWLASLGAYSITQAEGEKAFNALVKDGEIVQARTRKMADETIANVTDKAVSRWERGIGLPDINTLEPLADVLGLTLADLMHCHDSRQKDATPPVPLEDFFTMLRRQHTVDWRSVRTALLALSIALALWGIFACPGRLAVHWRTLSDGSLQADGWMSSLVIFPLFAGFEFLSLELWNNFEQTGYYRRWGEVNLFIIHAMSFGTPLTRLMRLVLDLLFFFCFGFLLPCCEAWLILLN